MGILKPTIGKVISTIVLTLIALFWWSFVSMVGGVHVQLMSMTALKVIVFILLIFVLYLLSSLIFHEFRAVKLLLYLICLVIIFFSMTPQGWYFSYLFDKANDCDNCIGSPLCHQHPYRYCECLGTEIWTSGIDSGESRCLGETKYTYYWEHGFSYKGKVYDDSKEMYNHCTDDECVVLAKKLMNEQKSGDGEGLFTTKFSSMEEWQQYCDNLNLGAEKDNCYQVFSEAQKYMAHPYYD